MTGQKDSAKSDAEERALVISARPTHEGAIGQEAVGRVAVVEFVVLHLVALPAVGVVYVRVEGPEQWQRISATVESGILSSVQPFSR